jgi:hypothetical protein
LGVVSVGKPDVRLGIVAAGVVLIVGCRLVTWWPGVIVGAALIVGVLVPEVAAKRKRRQAR